MPMFDLIWSIEEIRKNPWQVSCQNQDSLDYMIFRIRPARVFDRQALTRIRPGGISGYGEKRKQGEVKS